MAKITVIDEQTSKIINSKFIDATQTKPIILTALPSTNYELLNTSTGTGQRSILLRRIDNNLEMSIDGDTNTDVIIKNYYLYDSVQAIGKDSYGEPYAFLHNQQTTVSNPHPLIADLLSSEINPIDHELAAPVLSKIKEFKEISKLDSEKLIASTVTIEVEELEATLSTIDTILIKSEYNDTRVTFTEATTNNEYHRSSGYIVLRKKNTNDVSLTSILNEEDNAINTATTQATPISNTHTEMMDIIGINNNYAIELI